jgi:hypothetical protein
MAQRVVLHVGLMKSGTTFLQGRMSANRGVLADQGILFPGPPWSKQVQAVGDLAGRPGAREGAWNKLAAELRAHPGTAVVSMEFLGPLPPKRIARLVDDLSGIRLEAVLTVRDLGRAVPATWQEAMQNRQSWDWDYYLEAVRKAADEAGRSFWRQQGAGRIAEHWVAALGAENVSVITVPPPGSGPEVLWDRFRSVVGIADADWEEAPRANESVGAASAVMLGRLNGLLGDADRKTYNRKVKSVVKDLLPARRRVEQPIGFEVPNWLLKRSEERTDRLRASGASIVGDLEELVPRDVPGVDPSQVGAEEQLEAAIELLARTLPMVRGRKKGSRA